MPDSEYTRKHDLECLRLASDLRELANSKPSPDLRSQFLRMAKIWTGLASQKPKSVQDRIVSSSGDEKTPPAPKSTKTAEAGSSSRGFEAVVPAAK